MLTTITLSFADGEYDFALPLAQIKELQNRCDDGIGVIYARVLKGRLFQMTPQGQVAIGNPLESAYRIEDVVNTIRQGLLGGARGVVDGEEIKVDAVRANQLIESYVLAPGFPLKDAWALAAAILASRIEGYEPAEKAVPAADKKKEPEAVAPAGSTTKRRSRAAP